ncbi:unnamed protein product [Polarella glacialis]|uniref:Protein kinase domain-containing protein n=1 Tax=Polarella glacialis TaxID=89957 RepID=A0A813ER33_POLGL|nr:unnamed protein product [Polarella glacialis]
MASEDGEKLRPSSFRCSAWRTWCAEGMDCFWRLDDYEEKRVEKATEGLSQVIKPGTIVFLMFLNMQFLFGRLSFQTTVLSSVGASSPLTLMLVLREKWQCSAKWGIGLQILLLVSVNIALPVLATQMKTELAQHRVFLTTALTCIARYAMFGYLPLRLFVAVACPCQLLSWLAFHAAVGALDVPAFAFGVLQVFSGTLVQRSQDGIERQRFLATKKLCQEQQFLESMQACLQGMISTLFDASCVCDKTGRLLSWTPQLQHLLFASSDGRDLASGIDLCGFAASEDESQRLGTFLRHIAAKSTHQTETMPFSLSAGAKTLEVRICGMMLPSRAGEQKDSPLDCEGGILIGLQAHPQLARQRDQANAAVSHSAAGQGLPDSEKEPTSPAPESDPSTPCGKDTLAREEKQTKPTLRPRARAFAKLTIDCKPSPSDTSHEDWQDYFTDLRPIGRGSVASVHSAKRKADGKIVALKSVLSKDNWKLAQDEFQLLKTLEHPRIIRALDLFISPSASAVLVLEFFPGLSLERSVQAVPGKRYAEATAGSLFKGLLQAICYLHQRKIIHRDVKPANIMISYDMTDLRLLDFNTAKSLEEGLPLTPTGTWLYSELVVLRGEPASELNDIWSCGLCLYFMLAGQLPWKSYHVTRDQLAQRISSEELNLRGPHWQGISEQCKSVLRQSLMREQRFRPKAVTLLMYEWFWHGRGQSQVASTRGTRSFSPRSVSKEETTHSNKPPRQQRSVSSSGSSGPSPKLE